MAGKTTVIMRDEQDAIVFELFELSPHNEVVMNMEGRLSLPSVRCILNNE